MSENLNDHILIYMHHNKNNIDTIYMTKQDFEKKKPNKLYTTTNIFVYFKLP